MIALAIALVVLGSFALYGYQQWLQVKHPRANSPEAEFQDLKKRVGLLELRLLAKPEAPKSPPAVATIFTRMGG